MIESVPNLTVLLKPEEGGILEAALFQVQVTKDANISQSKASHNLIMAKIASDTSIYGRVSAIDTSGLFTFPMLSQIDVGTCTCP